MGLLFGGLEDKAVGEIVTALDQMGVPHEVRGSGVYVPEGERYRIRAQLAGDGLVKDGAVGYELLDGMSGFGTTREMFRTAVLRATQGELKRTIEAMPEIAFASVMIALGERRPFSREESKATASVSIRAAGGRLSDRSANAVRYLVALAVPGLEPDQVAVIDMQHGVILKPGDERNAEATEEREERIAERMRQKLEALLIANVGEGNFRVSVTVETSREMLKVSERILDPDSQVPTTSDTSETSEQSTNPAAPVTVASNLPDGDAAQNSGGETNRTTARETVSYTYSETVRDEIVEPGAVKRIGVAVVLDERETVGPEGDVTRSPRSREELATIEQLVKSAIAFDETRGDSVKVESLAFVDQADEMVIFEEQSALDALIEDHGATVAQLLVLGLVALLLGLFVVRPILTNQARAEEEYQVIEGTLAPGAGPENYDVEGDFDGATGDRIAADGTSGGMGAIGADGSPAALADGVGETPALGAPPANAALAASLLGDNALSQNERLREIAREKSEETLTVLKRWLNTKPEDAAERAR